MPKVSTEVQRRIADLDAKYTVAQPKRAGRFFRRGLALIILAIIALAAFFSADRTSSDFLRLTLKQGPAGPNRQPEAQAKWNAVSGPASTGFKSGE